MSVTTTQWRPITVEIEGPTIKGKKTYKAYSDLEDVQTGDIYLYESEAMLRKKCFAVFITAPFYAIAHYYWFSRRILFDLVHQIGLTFISSIGKSWKEEKVFLDSQARTLAQLIRRDFRNVVTIPYYLVRIMLAALSGIRSPYEGRKRVALIEREWHEEISIKEDFRYAFHRHGLIQGVIQSRVCYLAFCFQPVSHINKPATHRVYASPSASTA